MGKLQWKWSSLMATFSDRSNVKSNGEISTQTELKVTVIDFHRKLQTQMELWEFSFSLTWANFNFLLVCEVYSLSVGVTSALVSTDFIKVQPNSDARFWFLFSPSSQTSLLYSICLSKIYIQVLVFFSLFQFDAKFRMLNLKAREIFIPFHFTLVLVLALAQVANRFWGKRQN